MTHSIDDTATHIDMIGQTLVAVNQVWKHAPNRNIILLKHINTHLDVAQLPDAMVKQLDDAPDDFRLIFWWKNLTGNIVVDQNTITSVLTSATSRISHDIEMQYITDLLAPAIVLKPQTSCLHPHDPSIHETNTAHANANDDRQGEQQALRLHTPPLVGTRDGPGNLTIESCSPDPAIPTKRKAGRPKGSIKKKKDSVKQTVESGTDSSEESCT